MSRKVTMLALCLVAAFAVSGVVSALASAAMELPKFTGTATSGTGTNGAGKLSVEGGASITCTSSSDTLAVGSSRNEGTGTLDFSGCAQGGEACNSLADPAGTILSTGEWHLVLFTKSSVDGHYFLFVLPTAQLHIECAKSAVKLLLIAGNVLGSITQKSGSTTAFTVKVSSTEKAQEFSEYENNGGTAVKASLKTSQEGGKAKASFENAEEGVLTFGSATAIEK
jgi:hypothetical protein